MDKAVKANGTLISNGVNYDTFRDNYSISFPAGNGTIICSATSNGYSFSTEEFKGWSIEYEQNKERFIVTTEDGTKYVFGMYLVGKSTNTMLFPGDNGTVDSSPIMEWKLTAILRADYVDAGGDNLDPLDSPNPATSNKGNWVAILWKVQESPWNENDLKKWNYQVDRSNRMVSLEEITYPYRIVTPVNVAEFHMEREQQNAPMQWGYQIWQNVHNLGPSPYFTPDVYQSGGYLNQRLREVVLYKYSGNGSTPSTSIIKGVKFLYDDTQKRTTLKEVQEFGTNNISVNPPYKFTYYNNIPQDMKYDAESKLMSNAFPEKDCRVGIRGWYNGNDQYGYQDVGINGLEYSHKWNIPTKVYKKLSNS